MGEPGVRRFAQLFSDLAIDVVPFDHAQADRAIAAFARYGKGMNPASRLNFGDCASYALATSLNVPLLYKGDDFTHTDVLKVVV